MSYTKHNFATGGTIQAAPFNEMEDQIAANETAIAEKISQNDLSGQLTPVSAANQHTRNMIADAYDSSASYADGSYYADTYQGIAKLVRYNEEATGNGGTMVSETFTTVGAELSALMRDKADAAALSALIARVTALENLSLGVTSEIKEALLQIARKTAYIDGGGQTYYQALYSALYADRVLSSITAVLALGAHTVYEDDTLNSLQPYLTVTAHYSDGGTATVSGYTLGGALAVGTSTITVSYEGKTTAFTVTVASRLPAGYTRLAYVAADGSQYVALGLSAGQTARAEYEIMYTSMPSTKGGHVLSSTTTYFPFFKGSGESKVVQCKYWGTEPENGTNSFDWQLNARYKIEAYPQVKINDATVFTLAKGETSGSSNYTLFTYGGSVENTSYRFYGRLYYAKIWYENGTLMRNLIPCKNGSDVAGLYDLVTSTFYTSDSATALIAGEVA